MSRSSRSKKEVGGLRRARNGQHILTTRGLPCNYWISTSTEALVGNRRVHLLSSCLVPRRIAYRLIAEERQAREGVMPGRPAHLEQKVSSAF